MKLGSIGFEFFIILHGSVGVYIWLELNEKLLEERKKNEFYTNYIDVLYPPNDRHLTEVRILSAGDSFGELALLGGKSTPRSATIISKEFCHFCVLDRLNFTSILSVLFF